MAFLDALANGTRVHSPWLATALAAKFAVLTCGARCEAPAPRNRSLKMTRSLPAQAPRLVSDATTEARALWRAFAPLVSGRASSDEVVLTRYARDTSDRCRQLFLAGRSPPRPDLVVWPESIGEVQALVRRARELDVPVIPVGGLTNRFGAAHFGRSGLCVDLKRMNRILDIDEQAMEVSCEAGIAGARLASLLDLRGLSLGHAPSSLPQATVGGWIASRAAGEASGYDGRIEDRLVGITAVDGLGRVCTLSACPQHREGDLAPFVGSEGTLGIVCAARLRLARKSPQHRFVTFALNGFEMGIDALRALLRAGLRPAMARLCDPLSSAFLTHALLNASPRAKGALQGMVEERLRAALSELVAGRLKGAALAMNLAARALRKSQLILVFEGAPTLCALQAEEATRILSGLSGLDLGWELARHWFDNRLSERSIYARLASFGALCLDFDLAVDWATAGRLFRKVKRALSPQALVIARLSQPRGEGACLHFSLIAPPETSPEVMEARRAQLFNHVLGLARAEGAVFGHHGTVGIDRIAAFRAELGSGERLLRRLKARFDPEGRLNPGRLGLEAPATAECGDRRDRAEMPTHLPPERIEPCRGSRGTPTAMCELGLSRAQALGERPSAAVDISRRGALGGTFERLGGMASRLFRRMAAHPEDALDRGSEAWALVRRVRRDAGVSVRLADGAIQLFPASVHEAARALALAQSMGAQATEQGYALRLVLDGFDHIAEPNPFDGSVRVGAAAALGEVEATLRRAGFTLGGLTPGALGLTVGEWLEGRWAGLRAGFLGQLESSVLSLTAILREGGIFESHLIGMRAGPKLESLLLGGAGCLGPIIEARLFGLPLPEAEECFHLVLEDPCELPRLLREALSCDLFFTEGSVRQKGDGRICLRLNLASQSFRKARDRACLRAILKNHGQLLAMGEVSELDVAHEFEVPLTRLSDLLRRQPHLALHRITAQSVVIVGPADVDIGRDLFAHPGVA